MREKVATAAVVLALVLAWGVGFLWFRGDLHLPSAKPTAAAAHSSAPSSTASPTASPSIAPSGTPSPAPSYAGKVSLKQERQAVQINPAFRRGVPQPLAPVANWTMATFNLLGNSHTSKGGDDHRHGPGTQRINGAITLLAQHQVTVVGLQEFQQPQRVAFRARAAGWDMWPTMGMPASNGENTVAWRTDTWEAVQTKLVSIPYFNGHPRQMPYVLLRNKATGVQAWFSSFHNPADVRQFQHQQGHRAAATAAEIRLVNSLVPTGTPIFVTGDMNERADYFCKMTGSTPLVAAQGGSNSGGCRPPAPLQIDWIFGSRGVVFSNYVIDRSPLDRRTSDHPIVVTHVTVDALRFKHAFAPQTPGPSAGPTP